MSGITITAEKDVEAKKNSQPSIQYKIFPNPVMRGSAVNVEFRSDRQHTLLARLVSLNGNVVAEESFQINTGTHSKPIFTQSRWAAGIYFIQLLYENGQVLASEKIIIQ